MFSPEMLKNKAALKNMLEGVAAMVSTVGNDETAEFRAKGKAFMACDNVQKLIDAAPQNHPAKAIQLTPGDTLCINIDVTDPEGEVMIWEKNSNRCITKLSIEQLRDLFANLTNLLK